MTSILSSILCSFTVIKWLNLCESRPRNLSLQPAKMATKSLFSNAVKSNDMLVNFSHSKIYTHYVKSSEGSIIQMAFLNEDWDLHSTPTTF